MRDFPYDAEAREDQVCQLIDARTKAIRLDILTGRESTTRAVLERLDIDADEDEARMVMWRAVVCGSSAVGAEHAEAVAHAIFKEAEALAEADVAEMERSREQSRDECRIARAECDRAVC
jgi:CO/xanthine dehydrogenase Mo-binding subunit